MGCVSSRSHRGPGQFDAHGLKYPPSPKSSHSRRRCKKYAKKKDSCSNGINKEYASQKLPQMTSQISANDEGYWKVFDNYPFENLVLSGGGSKGYAFVGALKALEDCGVLSRIRRVAGSSSGAICAGLIAIGCTPQQIADVFSSDPRWLFQDQGCAPVYCVPNIWKKYGLHPGDRFYNLYGKAIAEQLDDPDITFKKLYEKRNVELCIVVTNLNQMRPEYCHVTTTPDLPIRRAVRMSMSFPVIYQPIKEDLNYGESWYTDGGMLDQYPIHCFDGITLEMNHNSEKSKETLEEKFNARTLGLYVVSEKPIDYQIWDALFNIEIPYKPSYVPKTKLAKDRLKSDYPRKIQPKSFKTLKDNSVRWIWGSPKHGRSTESIYHWPEQEQSVDIKSFSDFVATTIEALLVNQRKLKVKKNDVFRTIPINCGYVGTNDYDIEAGDREFLVRQGYQCSYHYLKDYINQDYEGIVQSLTHRTTTEKETQTTQDHRTINLRHADSGSLCGTAAGLHNPLIPSGIPQHLNRHRVNSFGSSVGTGAYTGTGFSQCSNVADSATNTSNKCDCSKNYMSANLKPPLALSEASILSFSLSSITSLTSAGHLCPCKNAVSLNNTKPHIRSSHRITVEADITP